MTWKVQTVPNWGFAPVRLTWKSKVVSYSGADVRQYTEGGSGSGVDLLCAEDIVVTIQSSPFGCVSAKKISNEYGTSTIRSMHCVPVGSDLL